MLHPDIAPPCVEWEALPREDRYIPTRHTPTPTLREPPYEILGLYYMCTSVSGDRILYPKSTLPPGPKVQSGIQDSSVHRLPPIPNVICPMHMQMFLPPHTLHAHQASHAHLVMCAWVHTASYTYGRLVTCAYRPNHVHGHIHIHTCGFSCMCALI